jgi:hypothetical protein
MLASDPERRLKPRFRFVHQFILLSSAVQRLAEGMSGGIRRAEPVAELKREEPRLSVGWSPWREHAGAALRSAILEGKLSLYARPTTDADTGEQLGGQISDLSTIIPISVFQRLMAPRGIPTDHPYRPTLKTVGNDAKLLARLLSGVLVLRKVEFGSWYKRELAKGRWPSQVTRQKLPIGRPSKQTDTITAAILRLVNGKEWDASLAVAALRQSLTSQGRDDVPSPDTLARMVDRLYRETGDPRLRRSPRSRPQK